MPFNQTHFWHGVFIGPNVPYVVTPIIEIPSMFRVKTEFDTRQRLTTNHLTLPFIPSVIFAQLIDFFIQIAHNSHHLNIKSNISGTLIAN
jgi:hypothetical protein